MRRQSEHFDAYRDALARLAAMDLVYPTFESRGDVARMIDGSAATTWPRDPDGAPLYPGSRDAMTDAERKARMQAGEPYALRLDMAAAIARAGALRWREAGHRTRRRDRRSSMRDRKPGAT